MVNQLKHVLLILYTQRRISIVLGLREEYIGLIGDLFSVWPSIILLSIVYTDYKILYFIGSINSYIKKMGEAKENFFFSLF